VLLTAVSEPSVIEHTLTAVSCAMLLACRKLLAPGQLLDVVYHCPGGEVGVVKVVPAAGGPCWMVKVTPFGNINREGQVSAGWVCCLQLRVHRREAEVEAGVLSMMLHRLCCESSAHAAREKVMQDSTFQYRATTSYPCYGCNA